jgi:SAM-dependent methyltransferase
MKDYTIRNNCRLCSGLLTEALDLGETCLANELPAAPIEGGQDKFPLYLSRCTICGHVQLPVVVNPERLFRDYVYRSGTSPVFVKHLKDFARDVQPAKAGGFVVEIGSNDGTLLAEYKRLGFEVLGIDPAANIANIAELENKVPTIREFFSKRTLANWHLAGRKADLIIANNVFAHADDLAGIVEGVAELLADTGQFVFEVGYLPDVIAKGLYRVVYHEHLSYHHLAPLVSFFDLFGLKLFHAERAVTQGGSIRCTVAWPRITSVPTCILHNMLAAETPEALDVSRLAAKIADDKLEIRAILDAAKAAKQNVCGYGAPAQLTTTCAVLGITRDDIAFVVDDNPLKVGKFTPGELIPIVATHELSPFKSGHRIRADVCVIFSANFASDIINRHPDFKGEWVVL